MKSWVPWARIHVPRNAETMKLQEVNTVNRSEKGGNLKLNLKLYKKVNDMNDSDPKIILRS